MKWITRKVLPFYIIIGKFDGVFKIIFKNSMKYEKVYIYWVFALKPYEPFQKYVIFSINRIYQIKIYYPIKVFKNFRDSVTQFDRINSESIEIYNRTPFQFIRLHKNTTKLVLHTNPIQPIKLTKPLQSLECNITLENLIELIPLCNKIYLKN
jgi:hypothetical protein